MKVHDHFLVLLLLLLIFTVLLTTTIITPELVAGWEMRVDAKTRLLEFRTSSSSPSWGTYCSTGNPSSALDIRKICLLLGESDRKGFLFYVPLPANTTPKVEGVSCSVSSPTSLSQCSVAGVSSANLEKCVNGSSSGGATATALVCNRNTYCENEKLHNHNCSTPITNSSETSSASYASQFCFRFNSSCKMKCEDADLSQAHCEEQDQKHCQWTESKYCVPKCSSIFVASSASSSSSVIEEAKIRCQGENQTSSSSSSSVCVWSSSTNTCYTRCDQVVGQELCNKQSSFCYYDTAGKKCKNKFECSTLRYHQNCELEKDFCQEFNQQCVTKCSLYSSEHSESACSNEKHCQFVSSTSSSSSSSPSFSCITNCTQISDSSSCWGTDDCLWFEGKCRPLCPKTGDSQPLCNQQPHCFFNSTSNKCYGKCSLAQDRYQCLLLGGGSSATQESGCVYDDHGGGRCVPSCLSLGTVECENWNHCKVASWWSNAPGGISPKCIENCPLGDSRPLDCGRYGQSLFQRCQYVNGKCAFPCHWLVGSATMCATLNPLCGPHPNSANPDHHCVPRNCQVLETEPDCESHVSGTYYYCMWEFSSLTNSYKCRSSCNAFSISVPYAERNSSNCTQCSCSSCSSLLGVGTCTWRACEDLKTLDECSARHGSYNSCFWNGTNCSSQSCSPASPSSPKNKDSCLLSSGGSDKDGKTMCRWISAGEGTGNNSSNTNNTQQQQEEEQKDYGVCLPKCTDATSEKWCESLNNYRLTPQCRWRFSSSSSSSSYSCVDVCENFHHDPKACLAHSNECELVNDTAVSFCAPRCDLATSQDECLNHHIQYRASCYWIGTQCVRSCIFFSPYSSGSSTSTPPSSSCPTSHCIFNETFQRCQYDPSVAATTPVPPTTTSTTTLAPPTSPIPSQAMTTTIISSPETTKAIPSIHMITLTMNPYFVSSNWTATAITKRNKLAQILSLDPSGILVYGIGSTTSSSSSSNFTTVRRQITFAFTSVTTALSAVEAALRLSDSELQSLSAVSVVQGSPFLFPSSTNAPTAKNNSPPSTRTSAVVIAVVSGFVFLLLVGLFVYAVVKHKQKLEEEEEAGYNVNNSGGGGGNNSNMGILSTSFLPPPPPPTSSSSYNNRRDASSISSQQQQQQQDQEMSTVIIRPLPGSILPDSLIPVDNNTSSSSSTSSSSLNNNNNNSNSTALQATLIVPPSSGSSGGDNVLSGEVVDGGVMSNDDL